MPELELLLNTLRLVGDAIEVIRQQGILTQLKTDYSPLTNADLTANNILQSALLQAYPQDAWFSEEMCDDPSRFERDRVWVVDPIDGTKEFLNNIPEYAISVALLQYNQPILAAIYNPATNELFHAIKNQGAWRNHQRIQCASIATAPSILISRTDANFSYWQKVTERSDITINKIGSIAYKMALVAMGKATATVSMTPKSEWDIAAGTLLVEEAGGKVSNLCGETLQFNKKNYRVPGLIASSKDNFPVIYNFTKTLSECV